MNKGKRASIAAGGVKKRRLKSIKRWLGKSSTKKQPWDWMMAYSNRYVADATA